MTQAQLWSAAGAMALIAALSGLAEWRRNRRLDIDRPGWMPWTGIQLFALFLAIVAAALALRG